MITRIKIGPITYRIVNVTDLKSPDGEVELMGHIRYADNEIAVEEKMNPARKAQVILHEALHAVFEQHESEHDDEMIDRLSFALLDFIAENADFLNETREILEAERWRD